MKKAQNLFPYQCGYFHAFQCRFCSGIALGRTGICIYICKYPDDYLRGIERVLCDENVWNSIGSNISFPLPYEALDDSGDLRKRQSFDHIGYICKNLSARENVTHLRLTVFNWACKRYHLQYVHSLELQL